MLTHFDRLAGWACVAYGDLLAAALHDRLREELPAIAGELEDEDRRISAALREAPDAEPEEVQNSAFVVDSLRTALWAVLRSATFEETVCLVVNRGDDADTVGAITGALAGALYGEAAHPRALARAARAARAACARSPTASPTAPASDRRVQVVSPAAECVRYVADAAWRLGTSKTREESA